MTLTWPWSSSQGYHHLTPLNLYNSYLSHFVLRFVLFEIYKFWYNFPIKRLKHVQIRVALYSVHSWHCTSRTEFQFILHKTKEFERSLQLVQSKIVDTCQTPFESHFIFSSKIYFPSLCSAWQKTLRIIALFRQKLPSLELPTNRNRKWIKEIVYDASRWRFKFT